MFACRGATFEEDCLAAEEELSRRDAEINDAETASQADKRTISMLRQKLNSAETAEEESTRLFSE